MILQPQQHHEHQFFANKQKILFLLLKKEIIKLTLVKKVIYLSVMHP